MLKVKIDREEPFDLHDQVAAEIRRAIADGEATPGERLPPAKDLASVLGVNTNTVLRALRQLRDEGLLEFRRGRGIKSPAPRSEDSSSLKQKHSSNSRGGTDTASTSSSRSSKMSASPPLAHAGKAGTRGTAGPMSPRGVALPHPAN